MDKLLIRYYSVFLIGVLIIACQSNNKNGNTDSGLTQGDHTADSAQIDSNALVKDDSSTIEITNRESSIGSKEVETKEETNSKNDQLKGQKVPIRKNDELNRNKEPVVEAQPESSQPSPIHEKEQPKAKIPEQSPSPADTFSIPNDKPKLPTTKDDLQKAKPVLSDTVKSVAEKKTDTVAKTENWPVPESEKNRQNPVNVDKESLKVGKSLYLQHCASCHGKKGLGDGSKAAQLETSPGDFSDESFQRQSDGALFYKIIEGKGDMPSFKKKLPYKEDVWSIVNYLRTLR